MATSRYDRGIRGDDKTSTRIRYSSPPPREDDEVLQFLTHDRKMGGFRPRHTPPDVCAAQDVALDKARTLDLAIRSAQSSRRDSGVNGGDASESRTKLHIPDCGGGGDDDFSVKPPPPPLPPLPSPPSAAAAAHLSPPRPASLLAVRAPSPKRPFSELSSPTTPPDEQPDRQAPPAPVRVTKTTVTPPPPAPPLPRSRTNRGRKTPVRPSELRNLGIDAEGLDPTGHAPKVRKLYLSKGKWYEATGPGRPAWAEDEKEEVVLPAAPPSGKRSRVGTGRYSL